MTSYQDTQPPPIKKKGKPIISQSAKWYKIMELNWKVGYKVSENIEHGIKSHSAIVAAFEDPFMAEDFIKNCMPKENQDRFFVEGNNRRFYPTTKEIEEIA